MTGGLWALVGAIVPLIVAALAWPKIKAEAKKIAVETDDIIVNRLYAEIERLDRARKDQDDKIRQLEQDAADERAELERENRQLRTKVRSLETRVKAMENVFSAAFKTVPNTPEWKELLDQVDEAEAAIKRDGR